MCFDKGAREDTCATSNHTENRNTDIRAGGRRRHTHTCETQTHIRSRKCRKREGEREEWAQTLSRGSHELVVSRHQR
jgi:hypothetical protein